MLKLLVFLSLLFLAHAAKPRPDRIDFVRTTRYCSKDVNLPRQDASRLALGYLDRTDEKAQCFVKCFYVQAKIMDEEGNIDGERLKNLLPRLVFPKDKVELWIDTCKKEEAANVCEKAFKTYDCFLKQAFPEEFKGNPNVPKFKPEAKPMSLAQLEE